MVYFSVLQREDEVVGKVAGSAWSSVKGGRGTQERKKSDIGSQDPNILQVLQHKCLGQDEN